MSTQTAAIIPEHGKFFRGVPSGGGGVNKNFRACGANFQNIPLEWGDIDKNRRKSPKNAPFPGFFSRIPGPPYA